MKYVVVTGGVVSGLGKGISISSIGVLLKASGLRPTSIKIDPYLNTDAGTMSPFEHGEVFVLNDGGEADLDLGNYERFLDVQLSRDHNITTGKVYSQVINAERRGDYLGKTVQVIPHATDAIQDWIDRVAHEPVDGLPDPPDVCLVEVGGTVGDIESLVFLEALRQFAGRVGAANIMFVHVSLVPVLGSVGEQKTKPTQHSVKELRSVGISPDLIICRSAHALEASTREKLALFCQVPPDAVLTVHDVSNIYHVPLLLEKQGAHSTIWRRLGLPGVPAPALTPWRELALAVDRTETEVRIALVGKYTGLQDSYLSVIKSLQHAAIAAKRRLVVDWIDATALEPRAREADAAAHQSSWETVRAAHGILVPGGFGDRGVEGKIAAIRYARESKVPFLGICLGMQCAVIEYARNVLGWAGANSAEFDSKTPAAVVIFMPEINPSTMGGTMRLGARATNLRARADGVPTLAAQLYGLETRVVWERHRHRYEVNPEHVPALHRAGLLFVGTDDRNQRMEIIELDRADHPYYFATQYHPEFLSQPHRPSPPFLGFILASSGQLSGALPLVTAPRPRAPALRVSSAGGAGSAAASAHSTPVAFSRAAKPAADAGAGAAGGAGADAPPVATAAGAPFADAAAGAAARLATPQRPSEVPSSPQRVPLTTPSMTTAGAVLSSLGGEVASPSRPKHPAAPL